MAAGELLEDDVEPDPYAQFVRWFDAAGSAGVHQHDTMILATVGEDGRPSARAVLLRGHGPDGFRFYTNHESRKGRELAGRPGAAVAIVWTPLQRQIRMEGTCRPAGPEESDAYFAGRPRGHQLSAWASEQSSVVTGRDTLEQAYRQVADRFAGGPVPRPPWWGGYRLVPDVYEFWQGRDDRLHDRLRYRRQGERWAIERLSP